jgi:hypothetical protein
MTILVGFGGFYHDPNVGVNLRHECMLSLLIGCMELLFQKLFVTIIGLG